MAKQWAWLLLLIVPLSAPGAERVRTVVVFPLENQSTRSDLAWLPEGLAEIISRRLEASNRYLLGREERDAAFTQAGVTPGAPLTLASQYLVAETLGVDWAVVGSFNIEGRELEVRLRLFDVRSLKLSPGLETTGELAELDDVSTRLVWRLLAAHDPEFTVGPAEDFRRRFPPIHLDAFESYVRGVLATDPDNRIQLLTEADRRDPADHRAAFELGDVYFGRKDYAQAGAWYAKVAPGDENYPEALFKIGVGEFFLGHVPASERAFGTLVNMVPLGEVANNLGVTQTRQGQYAEALAQFDRASQADASDPDFSFNRAACLWALKRFDEAAKALETALETDPDDTEVRATLAEVYRKLGDSAGRERQLAWLSEREGAAAASEPGEDFQPQTRLKKNFDDRAFHLLSLTLENEREERLAALSSPQHAAAHLASGRELLAQGRAREAERELSEAISLDPSSDEAHVALAEAYVAEAKRVDAIAEAESALRIKDSVAAHLLLADIFLSMRRIDPAREQVRSALNLEPANPAALKLLDRVQDLAGSSEGSP